MTTPLHFLLQSNLVSEEDQAPYIAALEAVAAKGMATWSFAKLVPFAGTIEPDPAPLGQRVFPIGSTSMLVASQLYRWNPGVVFDPATFRFEAWRDHWGAANLINGDSEIATFGTANCRQAEEMGASRVFIRPCEDLKAFTGTVVSRDELLAWQERVYEGCQSTADSPLLTMNTPVVVAPVKTITREWRTWVVGGQVVAYSQYAHHGKRERTPHTPWDVRVFAQRLADYWRPADCFVLDVGELEDGRLGLMEVNTLNSSGIYAANMEPVYTAIACLYA